MYYKLQALRGIAATLLVFYKSPFTVFSVSSGFMISAYLFVDLFFVLSGFVLSHAYAQKIREGMNFQRYMLLRWARVYPLHLFVLLAFIAYELARLTVLNGEPNEARTVSSVLTHLLLIQSLGVHDLLTWNTPSWSISVEFYCYIVFFLLLKTFDGKQGRALPLAIVVVSFATLYALGHDKMNVDYDWGFLRCLGGFYAGVLMYRCANQGLPVKGALLPFAEIAVIAVMVLSVSLAQQHFFWVMLAIASFAAAIVVFASEQDGMIGRFFMWRPIQLLGEWSYSIYMVHMLVWTVASALLSKVIGQEFSSISGLNAIAINGAVFIATLSASIITYKYVEDAPRNWVKKQLSKSKSRSSHSVSSQTQ